MNKTVYLCNGQRPKCKGECNPCRCTTDKEYAAKDNDGNLIVIYDGVEFEGIGIDG
jgi:hypothetical protein